MKKAYLWLILSGPFLVALALFLFLPRPSAPNFVFVTVDTLRYDHTPFSSYSRETMPATKKFFADSISFIAAETPRTRTTPAYASMFTGLYPYKHGVRDLFDELHEKNVTLAELLKKQGYDTAAFVSSFVMIGRFNGLSQGFELYNDEVDELQVTRESYERRAPSTVNAILSWMKQRKSKRPFFLFLHFVDPHGPYNAPAPNTKKFQSSEQQLIPKSSIPNYQLLENDLDLRSYIDRYDSEIRYLDDQLARLYPAFEDNLDDTWFLFTADHGESLGEHDFYFSHGKNCFEAETRIPFAILPPSKLRSKYKARLIAHPVSLVDVMPTVLDILQLDPGNLDGESIMPVLQRKPLRNRYRFMERVEGRNSTFTVRNERYKLIHDMEPEKISLFDLTNDPLETRDLSGTVAAPKELEEQLETYVKNSRRHKLGFKVRQTPREVRRAGPGRTEFIKEREKELSEEDHEKLRSLGYVD